MHTSSMSSILRPMPLPVGFRKPSPLSPALARFVGVSALADTGGSGAVSALAEHVGVSRQTVYELKARVDERLRGLFEEREQQGSYHQVTVDRALVERLIVGLRCETPSSLRDIMSVFPICYALNSPSFGFVQGTVAQAEANAVKWMSELPVEKVPAAVLDEIFNHSEPILEVADLKSHAILLLSPQDGRAAADWIPLLEGLKARGLQPDSFVSDNGGGINASVRRVYPGTAHRKDGFHVLARFGKELMRRERVAYSKLEVAYEALARRTHPKKKDDPRELGQRVWRTRDAADVAIESYDWLRERYGEVAEALEFVCLDPFELKEAENCRERLRSVATRLKSARDKRAQGLGTYLDNQIVGLTQYMEELSGKLVGLAETAEEGPAIATMAGLWRLDRMLGNPRYDYARSTLLQRAKRGVESLMTLSEQRLKVLWPQVQGQIAARYRASSFIECVNSVLRPLLTVRKHSSPGAMALFAAWWNLHPRTEGPMKGTCPYTLLTGRVVKDWLSELGFRPSAAVP